MDVEDGDSEKDSARLTTEVLALSLILKTCPKFVSFRRKVYHRDRSKVPCTSATKIQAFKS